MLKDDFCHVFHCLIRPPVNLVPANAIRITLIDEAGINIAAITGLSCAEVAKKRPIAL